MVVVAPLGSRRMSPEVSPAAGAPGLAASLRLGRRSQCLRGESSPSRGYCSPIAASAWGRSASRRGPASMPGASPLPAGSPRVSPPPSVAAFFFSPSPAGPLRLRSGECGLLCRRVDGSLADDGLPPALARIECGIAWLMKPHAEWVECPARCVEPAANGKSPRVDGRGSVCRGGAL